jgi:hypothetical protein
VTDNEQLKQAEVERSLPAETVAENEQIEQAVTPEIEQSSHVKTVTESDQFEKVAAPEVTDVILYQPHFHVPLGLTNK